MPSDLHEHLCLKAAYWLKSQGFGVVGINIGTAKAREKVDCIGFRSNCSAMIESKVSLSDFAADMKKAERIHTELGVGLYRFYITPPNLITVNRLPDGFGLLELHGRKVVPIKAPPNNQWPGPIHDQLEWPYPERTVNEWLPFQHPINEEAEQGMLYSLARRAADGKIVNSTSH